MLQKGALSLDGRMNDGKGSQISTSVVGFFLSEVGLGQSARNIASSFFDANIAINCVNLDLPGRSNAKEFADKCVPWALADNNFYVAEMDMTVLLPRQLSALGHGGRHFLYPFWELDRLPIHVAKALPFYDEIFAPSQFIANTFSQYLDVAPAVIPQPVSIPSQFAKNIAGDRLKIFTFFDVGSYPDRKNPKAAIQAFQMAFPKNFKDVELVVKVRGFGGMEIRKTLLDYALRDHRIKIIDKTVDRAEIDSLVQACHVFLSLHRSEGFGFGPAESMACEKIVISTDYGGTRDFVTAQTGFPVNYRLIPVEEGQYPHYQHQLWADPSIEQAASFLKQVYEDFDTAAAKGVLGRKWLTQEYSFAAVGKKIAGLFEARAYL